MSENIELSPEETRILAYIVTAAGDTGRIYPTKAKAVRDDAVEFHLAVRHLKAKGFLKEEKDSSVTMTEAAWEWVESHKDEVKRHEPRHGPYDWMA